VILYLWETVARDGGTPLPARYEAAAIQEAFPSYEVTVCLRQGDRPRFEVVTRDDDHPWCLISDEADEIWHELEGSIDG
jgi:hypothetical protein